MKRDKNFLNKRQWQLYKYLKSCYEEDNKKYVSKHQIAIDLPDYYNAFDQSTRYLRQIEFDVRQINSNWTIQHIIVSSRKGYKIATIKEFNEYINRRNHYLSSFVKLNRILVYKAKLNNQLRITFGKEKGVIETFFE